MRGSKYTSRKTTPRLPSHSGSESARQATFGCVGEHRDCLAASSSRARALHRSLQRQAAERREVCGLAPRCAPTPSVFSFQSQGASDITHARGLAGEVTAPCAWLSRLSHLQVDEQGVRRECRVGRQPGMPISTCPDCEGRQCGGSTRPNSSRTGSGLWMQGILGRGGQRRGG